MSDADSKPKTSEEMQLSGTAKWNINPFKDLVLAPIEPEPQLADQPKPSPWNPWKVAKALREAEKLKKKGKPEAKKMDLGAFLKEMSAGLIQLIKRHQTPDTGFVLILVNNQAHGVTSNMTAERSIICLEKAVADMKTQLAKPDIPH